MLFLRLLAILATVVAVCVPVQDAYSRGPSSGEKTQAATRPLAQLPGEARQTIHLIRKGGPFPYERDGVVFGNFERALPQHERGYYREYTVPTPGIRHRGARR